MTLAERMGPQRREEYHQALSTAVTRIDAARAEDDPARARALLLQARGHLHTADSRLVGLAAPPVHHAGDDGEGAP